MFELIAFIIFAISVIVVVVISAKKAPQLAELPQNGKAGIREHRFIAHIESKYKEIKIAIEKQIFLHKLLSWLKIIVLRIETYIDHSLHKIRKDAQEKTKRKITIRRKY